MPIQVEPHDYIPISILDRLIGRGGRCAACYEPKRAHPIYRYVEARPLGSTAPANWPYGATWPLRLGLWKLDWHREASYEIEELKSEIARLTTERDAWKNEAMLTAAHQGIDNHQRLLDERDEAVRVAVWAAQHGANAGWDGNSDPCIWYAGGDGYQTLNGAPVTSINYNGTEADIYRALREAMGASEGGGDGAI